VGHADRAQGVIQCEDEVQEQGEQDGDGALRTLGAGIWQIRSVIWRRGSRQVSKTSNAVQHLVGLDRLLGKQKA
jgi:hypothetical protein